jgi:hypothetical protein
MDAMQKKRVKRAAKIHLLLTVAFIFLVAISWHIWPRLTNSKAHLTLFEQFYSHALGIVAICLQPISYFISGHNEFESIFIFFVAVVLMPLWSYFFGWIFIGVKDWLNHFPVLGKKVF